MRPLSLLLLLLAPLPLAAQAAPSRSGTSGQPQAAPAASPAPERVRVEAAGSAASLEWVCDGDGLNVALVRREGGEGDLLLVQWRFDALPPDQAQHWRSRDSTSMLLPPPLVGHFTTGALRAKQVEIRGVDRLAVRHSYVFTLGDVKQRLPELPCRMPHGPGARGGPR